MTEPFKNSKKKCLKSPILLIKMDTPRICFMFVQWLTYAWEYHRCTLVWTFSNRPSMAIEKILSDIQICGLDLVVGKNTKVRNDTHWCVISGTVGKEE